MLAKEKLLPLLLELLFMGTAVESIMLLQNRLRGLMFRKEQLNKEALWLTPCNSIHMFFMRFPLRAFLGQTITYR
jgi:hypothetical protein